MTRESTTAWEHSYKNNNLSNMTHIPKMLLIGEWVRYSESMTKTKKLVQINQGSRQTQHWIMYLIWYHCLTLKQSLEIRSPWRQEIVIVRSADDTLVILGVRTSAVMLCMTQLSRKSPDPARKIMSSSNWFLAYHIYFPKQIEFIGVLGFTEPCLWCFDFEQHR